jgi:hypothetical protein
MGDQKDIVRQSEVSRLSRVLTDETRGIRICGVNGVGGVGKTYLVEHVLANMELPQRGYLKLSLDGAHRERLDDFMDLIDGRLAARTLPPPAAPARDYFPHVRKIADYHRALCEQVQRELDGVPDVRDAVKTAAKKLLRLGIAFNRLNPDTRTRMLLGALDEEDAESLVEVADSLLRHLDSLRGTPFLYTLRTVSGLTLRDQVRRDLYAVTARVLVADLSAALGGNDRWDRIRFLTQRPIGGLNRLVLVIDDFEALAPTLSTFLIAHLVPRLAEARFPTALIVVGRDSLEATDTDWARFAGKYVKDEIRLHPFGRDDALSLLAKAGIHGERAHEVFERTQGLPFLLTLITEEASWEDGNSFLFLRKFLDRTTAWMTPREREWLVKVCYLDVVNEYTLTALFPIPENRTVMDWFEREASIRDPGAPVPRVRPLIRDKVLRYQELRSPSRHRELVTLASRADADAAQA